MNIVVSATTIIGGNLVLKHISVPLRYSSTRPEGTLRLTTATSADTCTSSPSGNSINLLGNTRGEDATWDRGALFQSGGWKRD
jgi:hypothetical protein